MIASSSQLRMRLLTLICNVNTTLSAGCPTNVTITPSTGTIEAGNVLTCSSDGYDPTYSWFGTAGVDGALISETGDKYYTLPEGPFSVICIATVDQLSCCETTNVSDTAYGKYQQESRVLSQRRPLDVAVNFGNILKLTAASSGFTVIASRLN